jgi:thioredoxin-related protein
MTKKGHVSKSAYPRYPSFLFFSNYPRIFSVKFVVKVFIYQSQNISVMKKALIALLLIPVLAIMAFTINDPLPIGAAMPKADVKMKDISGKEITLKGAAKENGLLVMFSCNTCPVVQGYQSRINEISKWTLDQNVGVILVNSNEASREDGDSYEDMQGYAKKENFGWFYTVDKNSELANAFGAKRTPEVFLFNKEGKLVYHGAIDDNSGDAGSVTRKHLKLAIEEMKSGKDVSTKETRSVGCGIKRLS